MTTASIEKRLTAIEHELAQLKYERVSDVKSHPARALERIHGSCENDESFKEAVRLGHKWRESQRPRVRKAKGMRK